MHQPLEDNIIFLYNRISAWYTAWNKDKHVINNDNTLKVINDLWKGLNPLSAGWSVRTFVLISSLRHVSLNPLSAGWSVRT